MIYYRYAAATRAPGGKRDQHLFSPSAQLIFIIFLFLQNVIVKTDKTSIRGCNKINSCLSSLICISSTSEGRALSSQ